MRIGVFDSGIGGLTILRSIRKKYPNNEYIYYGDTLNLPYGEKTKEQLFVLADKIIEFLISENVDIIVIACGTLSSNVYDEIKDNYSKKIYDIITPTVKYLKDNNKKNVLLLATPMTITSGVFKEKITKENINVYDKACPMFVPIIENRVNEDINIYIDKYLNEFNNKDIDVIIPGCTHYPVIEKELSNYLNKPVINIGDIIASSLTIKDSNSSIKLYFSKVDENLIRNVHSLIGNYEVIEKIL